MAITITAFVALLAYNGLSASISAAQTHEQHMQQLAAIQLPLTVLERDIRHIVNRPIKDENGQTIAGLSGGALNDYLLTLTRRGWDNPRGLARGELQRVRYHLNDEGLWRESWPVLDRLTEDGGQQRILLLAGVQTIELAFLDDQSTGASSSPIGGEWVELWSQPKRLPLAIQIKIEIEKFGEVRRVFSIPFE